MKRVLIAAVVLATLAVPASANECHISRDVQDLGKKATEVVSDILDRALMNAPESVHQKEMFGFVLKKMFEIAPPKDRQRISNEVLSALKGNDEEAKAVIADCFPGLAKLMSNAPTAPADKLVCGIVDAPPEMRFLPLHADPDPNSPTIGFVKNHERIIVNFDKIDFSDPRQKPDTPNALNPAPRGGDAYVERIMGKEGRGWLMAGAAITYHPRAICQP